MKHGQRHLRLVIVGRGSMARRVVDLLRARCSPVDLVGIGLRETEAPGAGQSGARLLAGPGGLSALQADLVVEAASAGAVETWGRAAFLAGAHFAPISTSAFTDDDLLARLREAAAAANRRLIIPNGAVGGIDLLRAASLLPLRRVEHVVAKPPEAWRGTAASGYVDLDAITGPVEFLAGSARELAALFPQNANATVTTSLAGIGLDRTMVRLVADPGLDRNRHTLRIEGDAGEYNVVLSNAPIAGNPKTSELTALSLVMLIEDQARSATS